MLGARRLLGDALAEPTFTLRDPVPGELAGSCAARPGGAPTSPAGTGPSRRCSRRSPAASFSTSSPGANAAGSPRATTATSPVPSASCGWTTTPPGCACRASSLPRRATAWAGGWWTGACVGPGPRAAGAWCCGPTRCSSRHAASTRRPVSGRSSAPGTTLRQEPDRRGLAARPAALTEAQRPHEGRRRRSGAGRRPAARRSPAGCADTGGLRRLQLGVGTPDMRSCFRKKARASATSWFSLGWSTVS